MRPARSLGPLSLTVVLAIASSLLVPGGTLAADTSAQIGQLSTAVYPSDGKKFAGHAQWSLRDGGWIDAAKWAAGDFDVDGKADLAAIWDDGGSNTLTVSRSTGTAFTRSHWATKAGGWSASSTWLAGDFTGGGDRRADLAAAWNDADYVAEHPRLGTHTLPPLEADLKLKGDRNNSHVDDSVGCYPVGSPGAPWGPLGLEGDHVGWGQTEWYGSACESHIAQLAVRFEKGLLDQVPTKTITRALLTYDEAPAAWCYLVFEYDTPCWSDGDGKPEHKPDGCVVVRLPTWDWPNLPNPGGLIASSTSPDVKRLGPREWDVTAPYIGQTTPEAVPIGPAPVSGYGFLLTGWPSSLDELTAQDSTNCLSKISNIRLHVTYTVPPGSGELPVVR